MDIKKLSESLNPSEKKVLKVLDSFQSIHEIMKVTGLKDVEVVRSLQWLQNKHAVKLEETQKEIIMLDENGQKYSKYGLPERIFLEALDKPLTLEDLGKKSGLSNEEVAISLGVLRSKNAVDIKKD